MVEVDWGFYSLLKRLYEGHERDNDFSDMVDRLTCPDFVNVMQSVAAADVFDIPARMADPIFQDLMGGVDEFIAARPNMRRRMDGKYDFLADL